MKTFCCPILEEVIRVNPPKMQYNALKCPVYATQRLDYRVLADHAP
jgi:hypothetical protein